MKPKKYYLFKSIFVKFVLAFVFVGILPLVMISYYLFERLPREVEQDLISNYNQILLFTSNNIEMKISEYNQISQLVYNYQSGKYSHLSQIFKEKNSRLMEDFLKNAVYSDRFIESAFFVDSDLKIQNHFTQNANPLIDGFRLSRYENTEKIGLHKKGLTIIPTHEEDYFYRSDNHVISFARNFLDTNLLPDVERVITIFFIEVNIDFIQNILDPVSLGGKKRITILDISGIPIYQSIESPEDRSFNSIYEQVKEGVSIRDFGYLSNNEGYLFYRNIVDTNWIIILEIPHGDIYRLVNENKRLGLILTFFLLILLLILAYTFSRRLSQPMKNIITQMELVESGDLTSEVTVKTHDEFYLLAQAFNKMVKELNTHINEAYVAEIKQKEAELNAIKTQIRPHYLYNTLEIIRMSALEENAENTQKMIFALSEQLKYVIGYSETYVTLGRELKMIENYFKILYFRYEQRIRLEIDVPEEYYHYEVLKLMIQPLVENAVIHGLKPKQGKGTVKISAHIEEETLKINIIDDGIGMSSQRLKEVQLKMKKPELEESIGLNNVQNRIELTYGNTFGIEMSSKEMAGTLMTLRIPARKGVSK